MSKNQRTFASARTESGTTPSKSQSRGFAAHAVIRFRTKGRRRQLRPKITSRGTWLRAASHKIAATWYPYLSPGPHVRSTSLIHADEFGRTKHSASQRDECSRTITPWQITRPSRTATQEKCCGGTTTSPTQRFSAHPSDAAYCLAGEAPFASASHCDAYGYVQPRKSEPDTAQHVTHLIAINAIFVQFFHDVLQLLHAENLERRHQVVKIWNLTVAIETTTWPSTSGSIAIAPMTPHCGHIRGRAHGTAAIPADAGIVMVADRRAPHNPPCHTSRVCQQYICL